MRSVSHKLEEIKHAAERLFTIKPEWVVFYREIMGLNGLIRRLFPSNEAMADFERSEVYPVIHRMLAELRKLPIPENKDNNDERVITIRIPQCMHEALRIEAYELRTSMNKLCISKLVQFIDAENVPAAFDNKKAETDNKENKKVEAGL